MALKVIFSILNENKNKQFEPIFKPQIFNNGQCSNDGSASFGLSAINSQSNIGMSLRLKIFINRSKVVDNTYNLAGGRNLYITTLSNVPEGSTYRIRFIVKDSLSGHKSKGGFKKVVDCIDDPATTTTKAPATTTTKETAKTKRKEKKNTNKQIKRRRRILNKR